jgi:hypothetical protein
VSVVSYVNWLLGDLCRKLSIVSYGSGLLCLIYRKCLDSMSMSSRHAKQISHFTSHVQMPWTFADRQIQTTFYCRWCVRAYIALFIVLIIIIMLKANLNKKHYIAVVNLDLLPLMDFLLIPNQGLRDARHSICKGSLEIFDRWKQVDLNMLKWEMVRWHLLATSMCIGLS